jgi:predicted amidohydrolase
VNCGIKTGVLPVLVVVVSLWAIAVLYAADNHRSLKVAAVQFHSSYDIRQNAERIIANLKLLGKDRVQVAIFPECALTGYDTRREFDPSTEEIDAAEHRLAAACREIGIAAVVGSVFKTRGRAFDTAVVFDAHGEIIERYGKVYLAGEKWATPGNHIAFF